MQHLLEVFFALVFSFHQAVPTQPVYPSRVLDPSPAFEPETFAADQPVHFRPATHGFINGYAEAACRSCRQTMVTYHTH